MLNKNALCCGNEEKGQPYSILEGFSCCGTSYVPDNTTVCCSDDTGNEKVKSREMLIMWLHTRTGRHVLFRARSAKKLHIKSFL